MSIQSNINNTIGQAAILASLNPAVQEMSDTIKAKRELSSTEKQLEELDKQSLPEYKKDKEGKVPAFKSEPLVPLKSENLGPVFKSEAQRDYYNKLLDRQQDLSLYMKSKGKEGGQFFEKAYTKEDVWGPIAKAKKEAMHRKYDRIEMEAQRAREQRKKVEAIQKQKAEEAKAAQEFRSKQIRDLIMNPNLEVNNGTGNDTRR